MPFKWSSLFLLCIVLMAGCGKVVVEKVEGTTPAEGIIYALPNTVVRIQLKVNRTVKSGSRYSPYAAIFAPEGKPVCKDEKCTAEKVITYSLQQGAVFSTYGEPDPSNVFLVKFAGWGPIDQTMSMTWNEAGMLSAASSSTTNRTGDVIVSGLKLLAGLGAKAALGATKAAANNAEVCASEPSDTDYWAIPILKGAGLSSNTLITNYCEVSKTERDKFLRDNQLLSDAVKSYVNHVFPLANARSKILTGTSTSMEPATLLSRIESEIDRQLAVLYLGTTNTQVWDGALDVRTVNESGHLAILHIDAENGICVTNSEVPPETKPIPTQFLIPQNACLLAPEIQIVFNYYPAANKQLFTKIVDVNSDVRSFRYRIPARVKVTLRDNKMEYSSGILWIAQLGTVVSLPANRHSKMLSYDLGYIEATGGLKIFKLGTVGTMDSATVDALSTVGGTVIDAKSTANKNAEELAVLSKEAALLKLRDDICTIQKKYGIQCSVQPQ